MSPDERARGQRVHALGVLATVGVVVLVLGIPVVLALVAAWDSVRW